MIYNERQYKITNSEIKKLKDALILASESIGKAPDWIIDAQIKSLKSQIEELESDVTEYELLKSGEVRFSECNDLSCLPRVLIGARIASGMSQKELGEVLGMTAQQIQRYEATEYMGASLGRLIEISSALGVKVSEIWGSEKVQGGDTVFVWESLKSVLWDKFPLKEMLVRGWFELEHKQNPIQAIREYFEYAAGTDYVTALHRKKFHGGNKPNEYSLLAWQARVLEKAKLEVSTGHVAEFELNDSWIPELISLSLEESSPVLVKDYLAQKGIVLIIESHLQGTYLDGAAMLLSETGNPVIGLTLRYDRLDNFWFVLFHELGHVFLHLFESLGMDFFDEEDGEEDSLELEADNYAQNSLIDEGLWKKCLSRFMATEKSVIQDAKRLGLHPSIVAGRIRKEKNNYRILNSLVGQGEVRHLFGG